MRVLGLSLVALASAAAGCTGAGRLSEPEPPALSPGDHAFSLEFEGRQRSYHLRVPPNQPDQSGHPVLLAFHGGGGNPVQFRASSDLDSIADREGLMVVYPAGTGLLEGTLTWNGGPGCCGYARDHDVDDVGFSLAVLKDLAERHPINESEVYATGHSNGSMMAYRVASEAPHRLAGAVGVAGTLQLPSIQPQAPVPILHIHSEDDPRAFYFGGTREDRVHPPVEEMLDRWVEENQCSPGPSEVDVRIGSAGSPDSGHTARLFRWICSGARLDHWRLTGVGHSWPGNRVSPVQELIVGPGTELISAAEEIWRFIESLR